MKYRALLAALGLLFSAAINADAIDEKKEAVKELVRITGTQSQIESIYLKVVKDRIDSALWSAMSSKKSDFMTFVKIHKILDEEIDAYLAGSKGNERVLFDEVIFPAYDKNFSVEEIRGLIAFYNTPVGNKLVAATPSLSEDMLNAYDRWSEAPKPALIERLNRRFNQEHVEFGACWSDCF
jgi:hypothetical protein